MNPSILTLNKTLRLTNSHLVISHPAMKTLLLKKDSALEEILMMMKIRRRLRKMIKAFQRSFVDLAFKKKAPSKISTYIRYSREISYLSSGNYGSSY